ncbi:MAG: DUF3459 domain-containing protein [Verrucomicrobia bacterium]|nr:DUF3459 domain-containing protein [Verrucomicrobiota bacterium]
MAASGPSPTHRLHLARGGPSVSSRPPSPRPRARIRRLPVGAEVTAEGVDFRVWAPQCEPHLQLREAGGYRSIPLEREEGGYWSVFVPDAQAGAEYGFELPAGVRADPASRWQPDGPYGLSRVVDPGQFGWTDAGWAGPGDGAHIAYELHFGTFTPEGTYAAAAEKLPWLADLGVTLVEVMPLHEFPGRFGWGYDVAGLFAPCRLYGTPDDLRAFIDRAHALGLGVLLDTVYNHFDQDAQVADFTRQYLSEKHQNEWGLALNFDAEGSAAVREFVLANVRYWAEEFHFDGLRLDAVQQIFDDSSEHIVAAIDRTLRAAQPERRRFLIGEDERQHSEQIGPREAGGVGLDAVWNDDFHHATLVALLGRNEAYLSDYRGHPQELVSTAKRGYLYQGQFSQWQKKPRGTPGLGLAPERFFNCLENHDQVANIFLGRRLSTLLSPARWRLASAWLMLSPGTPLLFQGQEFASRTPFPYIADYPGERGESVAHGRRKFLSQFPASAALPPEAFPDPGAPGRGESGALDWSEVEQHPQAVQLYRDLARLRRQEPVFDPARREGLDGAVLGTEALLLRYFGPDADDRLLLVNFGPHLQWSPLPEPLLAPPRGRAWKVLWSSEDPAYGGHGTPPPVCGPVFQLPAESVLFLAARPAVV